MKLSRRKGRLFWVNCEDFFTKEHTEYTEKKFFDIAREHRAQTKSP